MAGDNKKTNFCVECSKPIVGRRHNAKYCTECAKLKKKEKDSESWQKRKQRMKFSDYRSERMKKQRILAQKKEQLKNEHARELGINIFYYDLWCQLYPDVAKNWMDSHLKA